MNSADYVAKQIAALKNSGKPLQVVAWETALLCVGWAYVYGARGELCTPANRRVRYSEAHPTIKTACKNFDGNGRCSGCKWLPGGNRTRFFDCRGFTYWVLLQVYGWKLMGAGATSQWNNADNWHAKGEIATVPKDTLVCLFVRKGNTMEHTGFGFNGETCECSSGVQHFTKRNAKWTHWAIPACIGAQVTPTPSTPETTYPTLRKGSKGADVKALQEQLIALGYSCGSWGADGDFGTATENAVKAFQKASGLTVDGIVGAKTYAALEGAKTPEKQVLYSLTIPHLSKSQADALISQFPGATLTEERG